MYARLCFLLSLAVTKQITMQRSSISPKEFASAVGPGSRRLLGEGEQPEGFASDLARHSNGAAQPYSGFTANGAGPGAQGSAQYARPLKAAASINADGTATIVYPQARPKERASEWAPQPSRLEQTTSKAEPPVRLSVAPGRNSPSRRSSVSPARSPTRSDRPPTGTQKSSSTHSHSHPSTHSDSHRVAHGNGSSAAARGNPPPRHSSSVDHTHRHRRSSAAAAPNARDGEGWPCPVCEVMHPASWQVCPKDR
jgi:hypothetical protein